jgi:hypothetical protein
MATAAAVVAAAMRRVTSHLMTNNAVSADSAIYYVPDRRIRQRVLDRLVRRGVIVETEPDHYYIDVPAYEEWRRIRRKRVAFAMSGVAAIAAIAALLA